MSSPIPDIAFGTYNLVFNESGQLETEKGIAVILDAIASGYRTFDGAGFYGNETVVGEALKRSGLPRSDFFVISKVPLTVVATGFDAVVACCEKTLTDLQTPFVDLYLIHWPAPEKHVEAWKALEKLHKEGKAKNIGISNYTIEDYEELKLHLTIKPAVNQIEISPLIYRKDTIDYFQKEGIRLQAYAILRVGVWKVGGTGGCLTHPVILGVCQKYNRTPAQVIEKWCLQKNIAVIVSSTKKPRMEECLQISGFELSQEDIATLDSLTTEDNLLEHKTRYEKEIIFGTSIPPSAVRAKYTVN